MSRFVKFVENEHPTVGVEQEFHLIDAETADLAPRMQEVWDDLPAPWHDGVSYEVMLSILEMSSGVHRTVDGLLAEVCRMRADVGRACAEKGLRLVASASHPFGDWRKQPWVQTPHYQWVLEHHGYLAHRLLSFALHVHVGVRGGDCAVYVMNELRRWAFPLLALSANSPYFEGARTGLASTRAHLFGSMPRTGMPPFFADMAALEGHYGALLEAGDITRPGDLWWQVRVQPPLGTVELRATDLPTDVRRLAALVALTQAVVAVYQDRFFAGAPQSVLAPAWLDENRWKAMRYGLDGNIVEPETGEVLSMRAQLGRLLALAGPKAEQLGSAQHVRFASEMIETGNESSWQVATCDAVGGDLRRLELAIAEGTMRF